MNIGSIAVKAAAVLGVTLVILIFTVGSTPATGPRPRAQIPPAPSFAPEITIPSEVATVVGKVAAGDWYLVVRPNAKAKPLVIWTKDRSECEASANQFNIKSVSPGKPAAPAVAWCRTGGDIVSQLRA